MTAQVHEYLRLDGKRCRMACELYLPESAPGLVYLKGKQYRNPCSACWRGYIGFWVIKNDRLFLRKVIGNVQGSFTPPLFADWFSDEIRIPQGEQLLYIHSEFESIYESDLFMEIKNGVVQKRWVVKSTYDPEEQKRIMEADLNEPFPTSPEPYLP
jgi:hypothetical protein